MKTCYAILLYSKDHVATLITDVKKNDAVKIVSSTNEILYIVHAMNDITFGNKIAVTDIHKDLSVIKNSYPIGVAIDDIPKGHLVHVHNIRSQYIDIPENIIEEIKLKMKIK